jgi:DNA-binding winged helix-turn-helix (wHTH) protein
VSYGDGDLRRAQVHPGGPVTVRFGPFTLDSARRLLTRGGTPIHLTPKAFDLLALLVVEAPRVVPKGELHERLWPGTFVADATLVGLVKELRRALEDHDQRAPIIRTAHRVGYGFCLDVAEGTPPHLPRQMHWVLAGSRRVPLKPGQNDIGRDPECNVWVDSASVSRRHARIHIDASGAVLEDLNSKNGTLVNGVPASGRVALQPGDRIHIGSVLLIFRSSGSGMSTVTQIDRPS